MLTWQSVVFFLILPRLNLQTKPVDPTVEGGAQVQQVVNIECISDFMEAPVLNIQFRYRCNFEWHALHWNLGMEARRGRRIKWLGLFLFKIKGIRAEVWDVSLSSSADWLLAVWLGLLRQNREGKGVVPLCAFRQDHSLFGTRICALFSLAFPRNLPLKAQVALPFPWALLPFPSPWIARWLPSSPAALSPVPLGISGASQTQASGCVLAAAMACTGGSPLWFFPYYHLRLASNIWRKLFFKKPNIIRGIM